jgi:hypothetical protein
VIRLDSKSRKTRVTQTHRAVPIGLRVRKLSMTDLLTSALCGS